MFSSRIHVHVIQIYSFISGIHSNLNGNGVLSTNAIKDHDYIGIAWIIISTFITFWWHLWTCTCTCICACTTCTCMWKSVFLISSYGAPLAQRASYLAHHSSLFGPDGAVNCDYIVTNSINSLLIVSKCIPNGTHTNHY